MYSYTVISRSLLFLLANPLISGGGSGRLAGAPAPARKFFSSFSFKILIPFRINFLI
jgi:hypothetical protein